MAVRMLEFDPKEWVTIREDAMVENSRTVVAQCNAPRLPQCQSAYPSRSYTSSEHHCMKFVEMLSLVVLTPS